MTRTEAVKRRVLIDSDMDYIGICPSAILENEPDGRRPSNLLPNAKSILVFGRKLISGSVQAKFRQFEDGVMNVSGAYSAHSFVLSVNQLCMKETYDIAQYLENNWNCFAMPLTNNVLQAVQPEENYVPFFADPLRAGLPLDIYKAAFAAGIGEMGWNHRILTPDNGPRVYLCAILTSMEFEEYDKPYSGKKLCEPEKCCICSRVCPTHSLDEKTGEKRSVGKHEFLVGKLDVNGCAAACFGFRKETNPMCFAPISEHPDDAELSEALRKQFAAPGFQTLDHLPMYHCERCLIYCPVGNWNEKFLTTGLSQSQGGNK